MKITFLLPHLRSAGGVLAPLMYAHELAKKGHKVTVAVESKRWTRYIWNLFYRHPLLPWTTRVKVIRVKNFSLLPDGDVFMAVSWQDTKKLHNLKIRAKKFFYLQHDERMYHGEPKLVEETFRYPIKRIPNATWIQRLFKNEFGEDLPVLLNAIDVKIFNPDKRDRDPNDGVIKVLVLHHDYEWKGTKEGVEIVQNLKKKHPEKNIKLVLFGTRQKQVDYVCDEYYYKLHDVRLARLFANSDIFLGPSWDEGLNFPPRWAMASGCAVVTYDNGATEDYAFDGKTALVAKRKDKEDLSGKLEKLIIDEKMRKEIAKNGMEFVRNMPTWTELTDKLEKIFQSNA